jgi:hypothetical protein
LEAAFGLTCSFCAHCLPSPLRRAHYADGGAGILLMSIMSPDSCLRLRKTGIGVDVQYILVRRQAILSASPPRFAKHSASAQKARWESASRDLDMRRRDVSKTLIASATGAVLLPFRASAAASSEPHYPRTAGEIAAQVVPTNDAYAALRIVDVRRYGFDTGGPRSGVWLRSAVRSMKAPWNFCSRWMWPRSRSRRSRALTCH